MGTALVLKNEIRIMFLVEKVMVLPAREFRLVVDILSFKYDGMKRYYYCSYCSRYWTVMQKWEKNYESVDNCIHGLSKG